MVQLNKYELFGDETSEVILTSFQKLYELGMTNELGKLSDLQKEVMMGVASGMSYSKLQKHLSKKHIASIQAPLSGGIKNLLDAIIDTVWLFNNPQLLDWLNENVEKRSEYGG